MVLTLFVVGIANPPRVAADLFRYAAVGDEIEIEEAWGTEGEGFRAALTRKTLGGQQSFYLLRFDRSMPGTISGVDWLRLFRHLPPDAVLRDMRRSDGSGKVYSHPDRVRRIALENRLRSDSAEGEAAFLAGIRELVRFESRASVLQLAIRDGFQFDSTWVSCLDAMRDGVDPGGFFLPSSEGVPPGGFRAAAVHEVLSALGQRPGVAGWADRVVRAGEHLDFGSWKGKFLSGMVGRASVPAILAAARTLEGVGQRYDVLNDLVESDLDVEAANRVAAAVPSIDSASYEARILKRLVGVAPNETVLESAGSISSASSRFDVLSALADQPADALSPDAADRIVRVVAEQNLTNYQSELLARLIGKARTDVLLEAADSIRSAGARREFLIRLVSTGGLTHDQATRLAAGVGKMKSSTDQVRLLKALIGIAEPAAIVKAAAEIPGASGRAEVLGDLAESGSLAEGDADLIAGSASNIGSASAATRLLIALSGRASVPALIPAAERVSSAGGRFNVLMAMARRPGLEQEHADLIASASPLVGSSSYRSRLLLALVGRASPRVIRDQAATISSSAARTRVLKALDR